MKKYIITVIFAIGFVMGLNAQNDGFFSAPENNNMFRNSTIFDNGEPALVASHGLEEHQDADAPLGTGLVVLSAMGLAYAIRRKNNE